MRKFTDKPGGRKRAPPKTPAKPPIKPPVRPRTTGGSAGDDEEHLQRLKTIHDAIDRALEEAVLSGPVRQQYRAVACDVVGQMTPAALERFSRNITGFKFYASHENLTEAYRRKYPRAKITKIKAAFDPHGILHLDGGENLFSRKAPLAEFYAHEATHAIDGTDHAISGTEDWKKAWRKEIAETGIFGENGASKPSEGFAEFGQLLLATPNVTRKQVREVLPRCLKVWEAHGL